MHRPFTFFLAALVLMHATVGCCVHHAHSCEVDCCELPAATAVACHCDGHSHEKDNGPGASLELANHSNHNRDSHDCEAAPCSFVASRSADKVWDVALDSATAIAFIGSAASFGRTLSIAPETPDVVSSAPRLHVILSILLI